MMGGSNDYDSTSITVVTGTSNTEIVCFNDTSTKLVCEIHQRDVECFVTIPKKPKAIIRKSIPPDQWRHRSVSYDQRRSGCSMKV